MEIISATDSQVFEIVELWKEFWDYHQKMDPKFFVMSEDGPSKFEEYLRDLIKSDDAQVLVVLDEGQIVAYSIAQILKRPPIAKHPEYGFISHLCVKSEYRRKGLGKQILDKILEWFKSRQIDRIELSVVAKNQIAYSFWKKQGFEIFLHRMFLAK
ncbi:MAG: GNAT family N-acetyltransferase [candidate division Zixibacteria bacterium]|nr:GNAT family N-acetyltransferase [candidate division Zixibacteria bacterium]